MRQALLIVGVLLTFSTASLAQTPSQPEPTATTASADNARARGAEKQPDVAPARQCTSPHQRPSRTRLQLGVSLKSTTTPGVDTNDSIKPTFIWR